MIYQRIFLLTLVATIAYFAGVYFYQKKHSTHKVVKYGSGSKNHLFLFYKIFMKVPLFKRYFLKLRKRVETLYPADVVQVDKKTTQYMFRAVLASAICMIIIILSCGGDMFYLMAGLVMVYVIGTQVITISLERLEIKILNQFSDFLEKVRHEYHRNKFPDKAILNTIDIIGPEIALHISRIHDALVSSDVETAISKYTDVAPNRFTMLFAAIAASIQEYGDKITDDFPDGLFISNLNHLKKEVHNESMRHLKNNALFAGAVFICCVPIFTLKFIEGWAISNMPELQTFYRSSSGIIVMAVIFASVLIVYQLICNLKDGRVDGTSEHKMLNMIAGLPIVRKFLTLQIDHNYTKAERIQDDCKLVGDTISMQGFLVRRYLMAIALVASVTTVVFVAQNGNRHEVLTNFAEEFESSIVPSEEYRTLMRSMAAECAASYKDLPDTDENRAIVLAEINKENLGDDLSQEILIEVFSRIDSYQQIYYRWWYYVLTLLCGVAGYYVPLWILKYQKSIARMNMEDEVAQFQTLALILMHVDGMNVYTLLEWMDRFAFCFKTSISECRLEMRHDDVDAIQKMKAKESFQPFKDFCDNLLNIDDVGIENAFSEILTDRQTFLERRQFENNLLMEKKADRAKMLVAIPAGETVALYLILPFLLYSLDMMQRFQSVL